MDEYSEIPIFSLSDEEKRKCEKEKIPIYYWCYSKAKEQQEGLKVLKAFIESRIEIIMSNKELSFLTKGIARKIRSMFEEYADGKNYDVRTLEKEFSSEVSALFEGILNRVEKKKRQNRATLNEKKKKEKIKFISSIGAKQKVSVLLKRILIIRKSRPERIQFISHDGMRIELEAVYDKSPNMDEYCLYYLECAKKATEAGGLLSCSNCKNQAMEIG